MHKILVVDNEEKMCKLIKASLEMEGNSVDIVFSGREALEQIKQNHYDVVITDLKMDKIDGLQVLEFTKTKRPETEVIMITAFATQDTALTAMKNGAYDYLIKPFKMDELNIRVGRIIRQKSLESENKRLKSKESLPEKLPGIIGKSQKMRHVFQQIKKVCNSDTSVIIRGESGTGKELVAKAIHESSPRRNRPFVAINCAALPENLLESELFGFEKGAFTGAVQSKKGLFETADKGTVFLDEIGDMPPGLQAKLLRVLQNNELTHLGGNSRIQVDFRLITATHQNLEKLIEQNMFRTDLYYRINIFPIYLPALRERKEDIPELMQHFLDKFPEKTVSQSVKRKLIEYDYPGNVRELENIITRSALLSESIIEEVELPESGSGADEIKKKFAEIPDDGINLDELEQALIRNALEKAEGNKSMAAQLLGITRRRLYSMMERFGMDVA